MLWEREVGTRKRERDREKDAEAEKLAARYRKSVAVAKRQQGLE